MGNRSKDDLSSGFMEPSMRGQWVGALKGARGVKVVVELDDMRTHFDGSVFIFPNDPSFPELCAPVRTVDKSKSFSCPLRFHVANPHTGTVQLWDNAKHAYPELSLDAETQSAWQFEGDALEIEFKSGFFSGTASLQTRDTLRPTDIPPLPDVRSWKEFKDFAVTLEPNRFIFRGHESSLWRLRTHFHRTGRYHLLRFLRDDIPALHAHLSGTTSHVFNLQDDVQNAAFYTLAQHHGFPTPLLDWTHSPFISAFFAYRKLRTADAGENDRTRIYIFDFTQWQSNVARISRVSPARPHLSMLHPLSINNSRTIPQQALSTMTNVDDIEEFIASMQRSHNSIYLRAVDLPANERPVVMQELALMGITAGSMFPGLDGACEQMKERLFNL